MQRRWDDVHERHEVRARYVHQSLERKWRVQHRVVVQGRERGALIVAFQFRHLVDYIEGKRAFIS